MRSARETWIDDASKSTFDAADRAAEAPSREDGARAGTDPNATIRGVREPELTACAARPEDSLLRAGMTLGAYVLQAKLGEGGTGAVFRATHTRLHKTVALKILSPQLTQDPGAVARFEREMQAVGQLGNDHIVRATDAGIAEGMHYLVMEFFEGVNLNQHVRTGGVRPVAEACELIRQAARGLAHAHQNGFVHRDVKPSNLFLTATGRIKLLDLGLARLQQETSSIGELTGSGEILGTPDYMSPEQWSDPRAVDARTDLYGLGCTLFFLLCGRPPYADKRHSSLARKRAAHVRHPIPDLRAVRRAVLAELPDAARPRDADVPEALNAIFRKLLAKSPEQRYASADQLARVLQSLLKRLAEPSCPAQSTAETPEPSRPRRSRGTPAGAPSGLVAPFEAAEARSTQRAWAATLGQTRRRTRNSIGMLLSLIPPGEFVMGSPLMEAGREDGETQTLERISLPFRLGVHAVTQAEFFEVTRRNPSCFSGQGRGREWVAELDTGNLPVESVSWFDAVEFCNLLSRREEIPEYFLLGRIARKHGSIESAEVTVLGGPGYRLPTEAEWEWACRAGTLTPFHFGAACNGQELNCDGSHPYGVSQRGPRLMRPALVGSYQPNAFQLHDMHGNVTEWCLDPGGTRHSIDRPATHAEGVEVQPERVIRGGSWANSARLCRSAFRFWYSPSDRRNTLGFRVAASVPAE